jgi:IS30 family transposase
MKKYNQLTQEQRYQMGALRATDPSILQKEIAKILGVHPSTISRELKRNVSIETGVYIASKAVELSDQRRKEAEKYSKRSYKLWRIITRLLRKRWSPEQISGVLKRRTRGRLSISAEFIYCWIYDDQREGGSWYQYLPKRRKKRQSRASKKASRSLIPNRKSIHERPKHIEVRERIGDMEIDTVIGKGKKNALVTVVDRASGMTMIEYVDQCAADPVSQALIKMAQRSNGMIKTMTADNGSEFTKHQLVTSATGVEVYFADPYSSWQRGTNENTNGLIRRYLPKKTDFSTITEEEIRWVEKMLNDRPRKRLGYKTPKQVWQEASNSGTYKIALNT